MCARARSATTSSLSRLAPRSSLVATFRGRLHAFLGSPPPPSGNFTPGHISEFSLKQRTIATYLSFYFRHSGTKLSHFSSPVLVSRAADYVASSDLRYRSPNGCSSHFTCLVDSSFNSSRKIYLLLFNLAFHLIFQRGRGAMLVSRANHRDLVSSSLIPHSFNHLGIAFLPSDSRYFPCAITPALRLQSHCAFYNICVSYYFIIEYSIVSKRRFIEMLLKITSAFLNNLISYIILWRNFYISCRDS